MASNPPFEMEDQTDEDFFDKLVDDDDFGVSRSPVAIEKFGELSVGGYRQGDRFVVKRENEEADADAGVVDAVPCATEDDVTALSSLQSSYDFDDSVFYDYKVQDSAVDSLDGEKGREIVESKSNVRSYMGLAEIGSSDDAIPVESNPVVEETGCTVGGFSKMGSGGSTKEVKEVGWSSFYADSGDLGGNQDNGSSSDFFSGFNNLAAGGEFSGSLEDQQYNTNFVSSGVDSMSDGLETSVNYGHLNGEPADLAGQGQTADFQDLSSSNYWENMYPGWTYDATTGQWYPIEGCGFNSNVQSESGNTGIENWTSTSNGTLEESYLQQSAQSLAGTMSGAETTESVYRVNQVADGNTAYPEHMVFDAQYPGWYYDTIKQEWFTIESYTASIQSTTHSQNCQNQQNQRGTAISDVVSHSQKDMYSHYRQTDAYGLKNDVSHVQDGHWPGSYDGYNQQSMANSWHSGAFNGNQQSGGFSSEFTVDNKLNRQRSVSSLQNLESYDKPSDNLREACNPLALGNFIQDQQYNQDIQQTKEVHHSNEFYSTKQTVNYSMEPLKSGLQFSQTHSTGRSSAGRPAHALVTFGFGGKLIIMKDTSYGSNLSYGGQDSSGFSISVLKLSEIFQKNGDGFKDCPYTRALCQHSFPGPLVGGSVSNKDLNKWIDERIASCDSTDIDCKKAENLKLLLSLLKIACQHYGKLRSPFGSEPALKEGDSPESVVAKLFASSKKSNTNLGSYRSMNCCFQFLPTAEQIQATGFEVQSLLVSGKKREALQCAKAGQLWGPALILASQLGDQFYVDTVKQMALAQMVPGSPLRTLCLLIACQPGEVFSAESVPVNGIHPSGIVSQSRVQPGINGMLEDWEENLAIITANRTKDDELVLIHLGDCLWKERGEITAAHICYLVAEANFESYSDTARMCIIGADHWKCPRTYASPEAIQRTELYEYSKVLGNSQFTLQPFQPYKIIYAHMLAEVGKNSDSLKYCQALLKSLKNTRTPEVEMWKQVISSLDERIRMHQQGGYSVNLAPGKIVGKLLNFFDNTAHRVVGGLPPPVPTASQASTHSVEQFHQPLVTKVSGSQSTMAISSLIPSSSVEPINKWAGNDNGRMGVHNRSISEPDFGRTPRQGDGDSANNMNSENAQVKASVSGRSSRFTRFGFGSQLLQKTVGLVMRPRNDKQAKLGESNKFYYDEKLKRWVEEGADSPAEETSLAPPPTSAAFQNGLPDYNLKSSIKSGGTLPNGSPEFVSPPISDPSSGIPPIPPSSNQFTARGRMGVRSRYVDTFNQRGGSPANIFQSPSVPAAKPVVATNAKFFIPTPIVSSSSDQTMESIAENLQEETATSEDFSTSSVPYKSPLVSVSSNMQRFPSMGNIPSISTMTSGKGSFPTQSRRTASWSGSFNEASFLPKHEQEIKPLGEALDMSPSSMMQMHTNGGSASEELDEVEL